MDEYEYFTDGIADDDGEIFVWRYRRGIELGKCGDKSGAWDPANTRRSDWAESERVAYDELPEWARR